MLHLGQPRRKRIAFGTPRSCAGSPRCVKERQSWNVIKLPLQVGAHLGAQLDRNQSVVAAHHNWQRSSSLRLGCVRSRVQISPSRPFSYKPEYRIPSTGTAAGDFDLTGLGRAEAGMRAVCRSSFGCGARVGSRWRSFCPAGSCSRWGRIWRAARRPARRQRASA